MHIVYKPRASLVVVLTSLYVLSVFGLLYYSATFTLTNERLLACVLGAALTAVLLNIYGWPLRWEVGPETVRKIVGRKPVADFSIRDIATVGIFVLGANEVFQSIELRDRHGNLLMRIEKGHLKIQDIREFYEALAYYLPSDVSLPKNPYGWRPREPDVPERRLPSGKTNWRRFALHMTASMVHGSGLGLVVAGAEKGWVPHLGVGAIVFAAGMLMFVWLYLREPGRVRCGKGPAARKTRSRRSDEKP